MEQQQSDDGSIASSGTNGPATATPQPPNTLKLKKLQCCDLFLQTFKHGQLYESPLVLQAAIVDVAKKFSFLNQKTGLHFCLLKSNEELFQENQQSFCSFQGHQNPQSELSFPDLLQLC